MIRAYIIIDTFNGKRWKYVRDVTADTLGDSGIYYGYGDTAGDTYLYQGDTAGKVKFDFETLMNHYTGDTVGSYTTYNRFLLFPESAGDTYVVCRVNQDQPIAATPLIPGDTTGDTVIPHIYSALSVNAIQGMYVVEERVVDYFRYSLNATQG